jgi:hypothetical protein
MIKIRFKVKWIKYTKTKSYKFGYHSLTFQIEAMSIILSSKNKDQLLLDGFRYRRDRLVWRCIKDKCKGCARFDGNIYEAYTDHTCQAPNPEEIEKAIYNQIWLKIMTKFHLMII